jgi:acyl-CoA reductase-like NAD-dependent aldehyde dehydrogenase
MELGGSDAYIILYDADLEQASDMATFDVYVKQTDKPASLRKRFVVLDIIYDEFLALFTKKMKVAKWANQQMKILTMVLWLEQTYVMNFTTVLKL